MYICYKYFTHFIIYMALELMNKLSYFVLSFFRLAINSSNSAKGKQREPQQRIDSQNRIHREIVTHASIILIASWTVKLIKILSRLQCKRVNKRQEAGCLLIMGWSTTKTCFVNINTRLWPYAESHEPLNPSSALPYLQKHAAYRTTSCERGPT